MAAQQREGAADVIVVLVRDEHRVEVFRRQAVQGQPLLELAQREPAVDEQPRRADAVARLDQRRVAGAPAAQAARSRSPGMTTSHF